MARMFKKKARAKSTRRKYGRTKRAKRVKRTRRGVRKQRGNAGERALKAVRALAKRIPKPEIKYMDFAPLEIVEYGTEMPPVGSVWTPIGETFTITHFSRVDAPTPPNPLNRVQLMPANIYAYEVIPPLESGTFDYQRVGDNVFAKWLNFHIFIDPIVGFRDSSYVEVGRALSSTQSIPIQPSTATAVRLPATPPGKLRIILVRRPGANLDTDGTYLPPPTLTDLFEYMAMEPTGAQWNPYNPIDGWFRKTRHTKDNDTQVLFMKDYVVGPKEIRDKVFIPLNMNLDFQQVTVTGAHPGPAYYPNKGGLWLYVMQDFGTLDSQAKYNDTQYQAVPFNFVGRFTYTDS